MKKFLRIIGYLRNFYVITGVVALTWMLFFDRYSVVGRLQTEMRIKRLEADVQFYRDEKSRLEDQRLVLESDLDELERFARERYHMKRENEDLFLIVRSGDKE